MLTKHTHFIDHFFLLTFKVIFKNTRKHEESFFKPQSHNKHTHFQMNTSREEIQLKPMNDAIVRSTPEPAIGGGNDISEG